MTATIVPSKGIRGIAATDPIRRRAEYEQSIRFYLSRCHHVQSIVFAENSGTSLESIRELVQACGASDRMELLSVPTTPGEFGRGIGEAHLIRDAMSASALISALPSAAPIWKVTGRYEVRNLDKMIATAPETDLYIDVSTVGRTRPHCSTDLYMFTRNGYSSMLQQAPERLQDGVRIDEKSSENPVSGENVMAQLVLEWRRNGEDLVPRFRREPWIHGLRARDLRPINAGARSGLRFAWRSTMRRVAPGRWS